MMFFSKRLLHSCCENISLQKCILAGKKKSHISYFLSLTFHFQFPKSKLDISFKPNDTVAGCSLKLGGLHSEFIPLAILCHAVSTGSPFGEVFSDPTHAPSIFGICIHGFPSGGSFHSHCKDMSHGFLFPLHVLQSQLASFPLERKLITQKMFGLTIIVSPLTIVSMPCTSDRFFQGTVVELVCIFHLYKREAALLTSFLKGCEFN